MRLLISGFFRQLALLQFKFFCINRRGSVIIETALTLPIVLLLIFFTLEILRLNIAQVIMESIAVEATFAFIDEKKTDSFISIIQKHVTSNIGEIKWYFAVYKNLETMYENPPYGAEDIYWYPDKSLWFKSRLD